MKKLLMVIAMALAGTLVAQDKAMTLADARGKIGDVIADPASITAVMKQLSAADQTAYLAEVNAAISKMPGSTDEKTQKFLDVDTAALKGAKEGNLTALVAEVFATVPPNSLTVINERFAQDLFNRKAAPSKTYTDEQYTAISKSVLDKVQDRTATADNAGVRNTFAILMLIRASEGSPADLRDQLVNDLRDPATKHEVMRVRSLKELQVTQLLRLQQWQIMVEGILLSLTEGQDAATTNENGYTTGIGGHGLSSLVILASAEIIPSRLVLRKISLPFLHIGLCHRTDQNRRAKHILIFLGQRLRIVAEVEHQWAHKRVPIVGHH